MGIRRTRPWLTRNFWNVSPPPSSITSIPRPIILFGSHARGDATPDSDLDLFVEADMQGTPPARAVSVSAVFGLRSWPLDIVVYTPEEVARLRKINGTLMSVIEAEGKLLYESSRV